MELSRILFLALSKLPLKKPTDSKVSGIVYLSDDESYEIIIESDPSIGLPYGALGRTSFVAITSIAAKSESRQISLKDIMQSLDLKDHDQDKLEDQLNRWRFTKITIASSNERIALKPFSQKNYH